MRWARPCLVASSGGLLALLAWVSACSRGEVATPAAIPSVDAYLPQPGVDASDDRGMDAAADARAETDAEGVPADAGMVPEAGGPPATSIALSLPLTPRFSTAIHDYYVRCTAEENALSVRMTAAPGSTVALVLPYATPPVTERSVALDVAAGDAVVVDVTTRGTTEAYWVRCLPPGFPTMQVTASPDAGPPPPGYYLVGNADSVSVGDGYAMILDGNGVPVWFEQAEDGIGAVDVEMLAPGQISYATHLAVGNAAFEVHALASGATSSVSAVGGTPDAHELRLLPSGDHLVFAAPVRTGVDLTGLQGYGADESVLDCEIQEIDPAGAVVWRWDASDHFDPVADSTFPSREASSRGTAVDAFHCNSIDVDARGDLLVSARAMDSVFLITRATGAVAWKMGGKMASKDGAAYLTVTLDPEGQFRRQHDARFLPDGTISMFDDQTALPGPARGVIYAYDVAAGTATFLWQYAGTASSVDMGGLRPTPEGGWLVAWGYSDGASPTFTEIDPNGRDLLDFTFGGTLTTYRAVKLPASAVDLDLLRETAGR